MKAPFKVKSKTSASAQMSALGQMSASAQKSALPQMSASAQMSALGQMSPLALVSALCLSMWSPTVASNAKSAVSSQANSKRTTNAAADSYVRNVIAKIKRNWNPVRTQKDVNIRVSFKVHKDGSVSDIRLVAKINDPANEKRALSAIRNSAPFAVPPHALGDPVDMAIELVCVARLNMTVAQALQLYGTEARTLLRQQCTTAGIGYPPKRIVFLALKNRKQLLMFAGDRQRLALVQSFPLVSYSGALGPKLRQGDLQIPEGMYKLTGSSARDMLSLAVDYPNPFDRARALEDRRKNLGGDILIHGGSMSTGCLVISNEQMEEVFVAVHDIGFPNTSLIIAPCDLTTEKPDVKWSKQPKWLPKLYEQLKRELAKLPTMANP